jgi:prepilin-type processing-associated H-X9-DG protein
MSSINSTWITGMIGENPLGVAPELERYAHRYLWGGTIARKYIVGGGTGYFWYGNRHKGGSNYVAIDGHVEYRKLEEYIEDWFKYRNNPEKSGGIIFPNPRRQ